MLRLFAHPVACCWELLHKVWNRSNFRANDSQHFFVPWSLKRSPTMLDAFAQFFQHSCGTRTRTRITHGLFEVYEVLWVVSFPRCTPGSNVAGSYGLRLHTTVNTDATTHNIVGPLRVVASICTWLKVWPVSKFAQQHATDATCNIQQCWELLLSNYDGHDNDNVKKQLEEWTYDEEFSFLFLDMNKVLKNSTRHETNWYTEGATR